MASWRCLDLWCFFCSLSSDYSILVIQLAASAVGLVLVSIGAVVLCREYLGPFMTWLAHLHGWYGPAIFCGLFILVRTDLY